MPVPPKRLKDFIEGTVDHHAAQAWPALEEVTTRWRASTTRPNCHAPQPYRAGRRWSVPAWPPRAGLDSKDQHGGRPSSRRHAGAGSRSVHTSLDVNVLGQSRQHARPRRALRGLGGSRHLMIRSSPWQGAGPGHGRRTVGVALARSPAQSECGECRHVLIVTRQSGDKHEAESVESLRG